jgi:hypothetical protein
MSMFSVLLMLDQNAVDGKVDGYLVKRITIPFTPCVGLEIRLHEGTEEGWWDQVLVNSVSWNCQGNQFECEITIPYAVRIHKESFPILKENGWEVL